MLDTIEQIYKLDKPKTLFIGDRLDTDIAFANNGGIDSLLVLTGISTVADCDKEGIHPKYVMDSIGNLNV